MKKVNPFYRTKRWERKRENIFRRDKYLCRECKRYGKKTQANTVHHIFPLETYPEYALLNDNLLSLCTTCHNAMHDRITDELTVKGLAWVERVRRAVERVPPPL